MDTVVARATRDDVAPDPFPHLILPHAYDDELCRELLAQFPSPEALGQHDPGASNKRFGLTAQEALADAAVSDLWKEIVSAHVAQGFLDQLVDLFGDSIRSAYPDFEERFGALDSLRAGTRHVDTFETADALLDAQISINSAVTGRPDTVRGSHLDNPSKLFAGLFYLRHPDDDAPGGDLELARFRTRPRGLRGPMVYERFTEVTETVRYGRGNLVLFLNSPRSLHGVTVRSRTNVPRYFLNLLVEVTSPVFDMGDLQANTWDKMLAGREIAARKVRKLAPH